MDKIASFTVNHLDLIPGVMFQEKTMLEKKFSPLLTCV